MGVAVRRSWLVWLVVAFGALLAISSAQDIDSIAETARWPTTPGTIVASSIAPEDIGTLINRWRSARIYTNRLHLTYAFEVGGRPYTGTRWSALSPSGNQATHAMLRKYAPGTGVTVHYDPRDPSAAVLDTSWPIGRWLQLGCALALMVGVWTATRPRRLAM
ncbi:MAG TPA: DUF3592 domain-containing protein [Gemmatimonadaceae bacterium]|jgi:hypothetical protein|nr:DUF3592 domain-containing protein [Gemmatimonadaceae bacterium]